MRTIGGSHDKGNARFSRLLFLIFLFSFPAFFFDSFKLRLLTRDTNATIDSLLIGRIARAHVILKSFYRIEIYVRPERHTRALLASRKWNQEISEIAKIEKAVK
jgi:hypothetical protein